MTTATTAERSTGADLRRRWPGLQSPRLVRRTDALTAAVVGLALIAAGCGGGSNGSTGSPPGSAMAQLLAYSRCMRGHGISDFPDPTTSPGGGAAISVYGGPGSDLNKHDLTFKAATQACRSLQAGGSQTHTQSAQRIAAELTWAHCMRSHGLPNFPDPDAQGAFDRSKFNEGTPAFNAASNACKSLEAVVGPTPVYP